MFSSFAQAMVCINSSGEASGSCVLRFLGVTSKKLLPFWSTFCLVHYVAFHFVFLCCVAQLLMGTVFPLLVWRSLSIFEARMLLGVCVRYANQAVPTGYNHAGGGEVDGDDDTLGTSPQCTRSSMQLFVTIACKTHGCEQRHQR